MGQQGQTRHGVYRPQNMGKYIGSSLPVFRSSWELKAFMSLDRNSKILRWGSENFVISYVDETRGNETHRYVIDLFFEIADVTEGGKPIRWLIEIKPESQSVMPKATKRKSQAKLAEETAIVRRNQCKWRAAVAFCKARGWHFGVYTENGIRRLC